MQSTYVNMGYEDKKNYVIGLLKNFSHRGETFKNLYNRISTDPAYPENNLDFIASKFFYYKDATNQEKHQLQITTLQSLRTSEESVSEEELENILSQLS